MVYKLIIGSSTTLHILPTLHQLLLRSYAWCAHFLCRRNSNGSSNKQLTVCGANHEALE